jgi:hypothetical protein
MMGKKPLRIKVLRAMDCKLKTNRSSLETMKWHLLLNLF